MIFELALAPKESLIKSKGLCQGKVKSEKSTGRCEARCESLEIGTFRVLI